MGLDIYVGTFTRYYSSNWKTIVQQYAEETGTPLEILRPNEVTEGLTDPKEIQKISEAWRDNLASALKEHTNSAIFWIENNESPYKTDKPDWDSFGAVILWALYQEQGLIPPTEFDKDWTNSAIFNKSTLSDYNTNYSSLTQDCEFWLPINIDFTFRYPDPTEKEIGIASSIRLLEQLNTLNEKTWNADIDMITTWRRDIEPNTTSFDEKAKFGFSILSELARFSVTEKLPMRLDY
jgi:hypothetical protein